VGLPLSVKRSLIFQRILLILSFKDFQSNLSLVISGIKKTPNFGSQAAIAYALGP
jgi:hypothetical protein